MPLPKSDIEEINELIAKGETEPALVYLRKALRRHGINNVEAREQILMLSGRYHNWEKDKINGAIEDSREVNIINGLIFRLLENIQDPDNQAKAYIPPPLQTSPDPLQPAMPFQAMQHPRVAQAEKKGNMMKYLTWFFVGLGVLAFIGLIMEMDNETPEQPIGPSSQVGPQNPGQQPSNVYTPPSKPEYEPSSPPPSSQQQPASITSSIRTKMMQLFNSGSELTEDDLAYLDPEVLRRQLANTSWYHESLGYVNFDESGNFASYMNNTANFQISAWTTYGFYVGMYAETSTGDAGYIGVVPPGNEARMTVYVESEYQETAGFLELDRR